MKPPRKPRAPRIPAPLEEAVQRAIIDRLRMRGVLAVHVPNGAALKGGAIAAKRLKGQGMRSGFPDLACYMAPGRHALLEVKRPGYTASAVREDQHAMHDQLRTLGIPVAIVTSQDEAVAVLQGLGWPV